jgi:hypothetical protein
MRIDVKFQQRRASFCRKYWKRPVCDKVCFQAYDIYLRFLGYDSTKYGLQSQRKFVDLSLPIRLCGLPNNATLELIKREALVGSDTNVQVAVQVVNFCSDLINNSL